MTISLKRKFARTLRSLVGQKTFYRGALLLMDEARFDVYNGDPSQNGEPYLQEMVLRHTRRPVIFDVGANVGDWTDSLLKLANSREVEVHAFEPCAGTFEMLKNRAAEWKGVHPIAKACSDHAGQATLAVKAVGSGVNSLTFQEGTCQEEVELTTVDAYCRQASISHIDLLKIDAEGHDFFVLSGAEEMLRNNRIDVLQFEYNHRWVGSRRLLRDAFAYLLPFGYRLGKLSGRGIQFYPKWQQELETYRESNYVACREEWIPRFNVIPADWVPESQ